MKLRIEQDDMQNDTPRDWDNLGTMVCFHGRYNLGDKDHGYSDANYDGWGEMEAAIQKEEDAVVILPLYLYDHSGITMSVGSANFRAADGAGWDWGQVGFIFARKKDVLKEFSKKRMSEKLKTKVEEILNQEVKTYDQHLTGDVWGYIIEDDDGEHIDSCWGFYGREYCEKEAQDIMENIEEQEKEKALELKRVQAAMPCCHP